MLKPTTAVEEDTIITIIEQLIDHHYFHSKLA